MDTESPEFMTGAQKAYLANERPLKIESSNYMGNYGNRIRRFNNLQKWLDKETITKKNNYNHGWSSLASSCDGRIIVALDYLGKERWYKISELDYGEDCAQVIPAAGLKFEEYKLESTYTDQSTCNSSLKKSVVEGVEILQDVGSSDTFQMILLKSQKNVEIKKVFLNPKENYKTEQIVTNFCSDKKVILDTCILSCGISGFYDSFATINDNGEIYVQNFDTQTTCSSEKLVGNLKDNLTYSQDSSLWACLKPSPSGDFLYGGTRKCIELFDLRTRPKFSGSQCTLFSIACNRYNDKNSDSKTRKNDWNNEINYEMIGGITNNCDEDGVLYFCTNKRIGAVDKRMPGRVYTQMQLHPSVSFSKKVALPSGISSLSVSSKHGHNSSRLDYLATWWSYPSSHSTYPAAVLGCFDQSYNYCSCYNRGEAGSLSLNLEECENGDHSAIVRAPIVVRGMPLRIKSTLSCVDFSEPQAANRLSLPVTGFTMSKFQRIQQNSKGSPISMFSANIVGDIFMTELKEDIDKKNYSSDERFQSYYWRNSILSNTVAERHATDKIEMERENWIKKWWLKESSGSNETTLQLKAENQIRLSHLKTANLIYSLEPFAYLNSASDFADNNKLQRQYRQLKLDVIEKAKKCEKHPSSVKSEIFTPSRHYTKKYKLLAAKEGRLDSLGRINHSIEKAREKKIQKNHKKKIERKLENKPRKTRKPYTSSKSLPVHYGPKNKKIGRPRIEDHLLVRPRYELSLEQKIKYRLKNKQKKVKKQEPDDNQGDNEEMEDIKTDKIMACPRMKIIKPENFSGSQGIRSSDQLAENKLDINLRIVRENYIGSTEKL